MLLGAAACLHLLAAVELAFGTSLAAATWFLVGQFLLSLGLIRLYDGRWALQDIRLFFVLFVLSSAFFALQNGEWHGKQLLPANWMAESTKAVDTTIEEGADGYASGWWSNARPDGSLVEKDLPADAYFAEGHDGQWVIVVSSEKLVVARLGFTPERDDDRAVSTAAAIMNALR